MPFPVPVDLDLGASAPGGLLATARPLPVGWQRGISFADTACLAPVVMGECPSGTNLKPGQRAESTSFQPVSVIQAVECTTLGGFDTVMVSEAALVQTTDFALARELLTGEVSFRDHNPNMDDPGGNPALVTSATSLGNFATLAAAVACLDQELHVATSGRGGVIFAGVDMATWLLDERVIWRDGARWRTASGTTVIVSAGFDGRAPVADGPGVPPVAGAALFLYATAGVWAGLGEAVTYSDVDRNVNTATSRAEQVALAAFSPCSVLAASATTATAC